MTKQQRKEFSATITHPWTGERRTYRTNRNGQGVWVVGHVEDKQVIGIAQTPQFRSQRQFSQWVRRRRAK